MASAVPLKITPVLDPVERASEVVLGVMVALSFTGSLSVLAAGQEEVRTMMGAALCSNLAGGLTDAVMYLIDTAAERHRHVALLRQVQGAREQAAARRLIADELPDALAASVREDTLELMRKHLLAVPVPAAGLGVKDYAGALGVFALVVFATFPVVVPFVLIGEPIIALRVSNALAPVTLFICGYLLGVYASGHRWRSGFGMAAIGAALVAVIIALGG